MNATAIRARTSGGRARSGRTCPSCRYSAVELTLARWGTSMDVSRLVNFASILEDQTRVQAERTASMPFISPHLALMPDAHLGKGATVGSVIPTLGAIIPAAVGVDIGCGMMAVRTQFVACRPAGATSRRCTASISRAVRCRPAITTVVRGKCAAAGRRARGAAPGSDRPTPMAPHWRLQLGSLGSGNHFIEVSLDESGPCGCSCTRARAASATAGAEAHRDRPGRVRAAPDPAARSATWPTWARVTPAFDAYIEALRWAQRFAS